MGPATVALYVLSKAFIYYFNSLFDKYWSNKFF
jgi:hypothetical protein